MPPRFLKKALQGFEPYTPGEQPPDGEGWVKLNTNESPWPPSPKVLAAVRAGDPGAAAGAMREHIEANFQHLAGDGASSVSSLSSLKTPGEPGGR